MRKYLLFALALVAVGGAFALTLQPKNQLVWLTGTARNLYYDFNSPAGTARTEVADNVSVTRTQADPAGSAEDWPSYNRTLESARYSPLREIDVQTVGALKVLCTYDTGTYTSFQSGLLMVEGALIGTTERDIFSLDPATCKENWRTSEDYESASLLRVNRGAAYLDGRLFRGTQDGRVLAYDVRTGRKLWSTTIAAAEIGETVPAAPVAWRGLVFIGNAGGAYKGVKGRMYALEAESGRIVWEAWLVPRTAEDVSRGPPAPPSPAAAAAAASWRNKAGAPITGGATWTSYTVDPATGLLYVPGGNPGPTFMKGVREGDNLYAGSVVVLDSATGAYRTHYQIVPRDFHDWDVSAAPSIIRTRAGTKLLSVAPKDGHLYGFDLATDRQLYRTPVTRIENVDAEFVVGVPTRFCPGSQGGAEWNGPAYDPRTNLLFVGEVDWCTSVTLQTEDTVLSYRSGRIWSGNSARNPFHVFGSPDPRAAWGGWLYAVDADSGAWAWRLKSNYPIVSGVTPTAGGVVFFGDVGGNLYAVDAANGRRLWHRELRGAIGGGIISYAVHGSQKVAVAAGMTSIVWPTSLVTAKVVVLGLGDAATPR